MFYQFKRQTQRIRAVHEDEAKNLYHINQTLLHLFAKVTKSLQSLDQTNEQKNPFKSKYICLFKLWRWGGKLGYLQFMISGQRGQK